MTNHTIRILFLCAGILPATPTVPAQSSYEVTLSARLDREQVPLNHQATLTLELRWLGAANAIAIAPVEPPKLSNLHIIETSSSNRVTTEAGQVVSIRRYQFELRGDSRGMGYIEAMRVRYGDRSGESHTLEAPRLQLQVVDPVAAPLANYSGPITLASVAALLGAAALILLGNERNKRAQAQAAVAHISLEQRIRQTLVAGFAAAGADVAAQYGHLATLLRTYLSEKFELPATGATSEALLDELAARGANLELRTTVQEILQACDVVKFSGGAADPAQLERLRRQFEGLLAAASGSSDNANEAKQE